MFQMKIKESLKTGTGLVLVLVLDLRLVWDFLVNQITNILKNDMKLV